MDHDARRSGHAVGVVVVLVGGRTVPSASFRIGLCSLSRRERNDSDCELSFDPSILFVSTERCRETRRPQHTHACADRHEKYVMYPRDRRGRSMLSH